jgi:hypothetical protein
MQPPLPPWPRLVPAQTDKLAQLPGGRELPRADYRDVTKAARRLLKQVWPAAWRGAIVEQQQAWLAQR